MLISVMWYALMLKKKQNNARPNNKTKINQIKSMELIMQSIKCIKIIN